MYLTGQLDEDPDIDDLLAGTWVNQNNDGFIFDYGDVTVIQNGEEQFSGEYTIMESEQEIECKFLSSDNKVISIRIPYVTEDGELHLFTDNGPELTHVE